MHESQLSRVCVAPEQLGLMSERLPRIDAVMNAEVNARALPGAVLMIARHGQLAYSGAWGYLDPQTQQPMPQDAIFSIASMTKPLVTVAALILAEQGFLAINEPVAKYLPSLANRTVNPPLCDGAVGAPTEAAVRQMTVEDLMRHTSGFVYAGGTKSARIKKMYDDLNIEARETDITADDMLKNLGQIPLANQPGTFWEYSISIDVLGLLLERVLNQPLDVIVAQALLEPLGMKDTTWWVTPEQEKNLAQTLDDDPLKLGMLKSYRQHYNPAGKSYFKGGAGLIGSTADYVRYLQMMINRGEFEGKRYLSRKSVELMLSQHTVGMAGTTIANTGPGYGFGLGFAIRQGQGMGWVPGSVGDAMWAGVWGTSFWLDPKEHLAAVIMAQGPSNKTHTRMLFKNLVYGALVGE
jgi:CubicO group peptidase (beta-lactamase class C family)